jgi:hypothetical protein
MSNKSQLQSRTFSKAAKTLAILAVVRDAVCGFTLFLLACFFAGLLNRATPFDYPNLYVVWFALGMIPFAVFAHWRGALTISWRTVVQMAPLLFALPFVPMTVFDGPGGWILFPIAVVCAIWIGDWLLKFVFPESYRSDTGTA